MPGGLARARVSDLMLGGTVMAQFAGRSLNPVGTYDVVVEDEKQELARVRIELGRLR